MTQDCKHDFVLDTINWRGLRCRLCGKHPGQIREENNKGKEGADSEKSKQIG